jgi:hypothetical protein
MAQPQGQQAPREALAIHDMEDGEQAFTWDRRVLIGREPPGSL